MKFRYLRADEVECRIAMVKDNGVSLLLYKDARCDMNVLDETVGAMNWSRSHELVGDRLYCTVSIYEPQLGAWVSKQDVGTESYTEKEKGQASDSFKRSCVNWGIGRELYTAPFIWVGIDKCNVKGGKCYDRFEVAHMVVEEGKITELVIVNKTANIEAFRMGAKPNTRKRQKAEFEPIKPIYVDDKQIEMLKAELARVGNTELIIKHRENIHDLKLLTVDRYNYYMANLKKCKGKKEVKDE